MRLSLRIDGMCFKHFGRMLNLFSWIYLVVFTLLLIHSHVMAHSNWIVCKENFKTIDKCWSILYRWFWISVYFDISFLTHIHNVRIKIESKLILFVVAVEHSNWIANNRTYRFERDTVCNVYGIKCSTIIVIKRNSLCVFFTCFVAFWSSLLIFWWYLLELAVLYI